MAIKASELVLIEAVSGVELLDGLMNNLFADGVPNSGSTTKWVILQNLSLLTWSAGRVWVVPDLGGATISIGLADGTARDSRWTYNTLLTPSFSTPLDYASGLVIPTLTAGQKVLLAVKRDTTSALVAMPEVNQLAMQGTSPIT